MTLKSKLNQLERATAASEPAASVIVWTYTDEEGRERLDTPGGPNHGQLWADYEAEQLAAGVRIIRLVWGDDDAAGPEAMTAHGAGRGTVFYNRADWEAV